MLTIRTAALMTLLTGPEFAEPEDTEGNFMR